MIGVGAESDSAECRRARRHQDRGDGSRNLPEMLRERGSVDALGTFAGADHAASAQ